MSEDQIGIPLGEIGVWRGGGTPSKSNPTYWTGSIPWVSPKDMKATEIVDSIDHISSEAISESATQVIPAESIVMVTRSGILDHSFPVAITKRDVTINQDLKAVTLHNGIEPRYTMLALKAFGRSILDDCAKEGTTVASVDFDRLKSFEIPLAPLPEQRRIVAKLDALQSHTRIAREALDAVAPLLKSFRQSVLQAAVTGALTEEWRSKQRKSEPWTESKASDVCAKVQSGGTPKEGFITTPGIPFLKVYNIVNQRLQFEPRSQFVAESIHRGSMSKSIALPGDVLMNIVGPPLGKVAVVSDEYPEWNINQAITLFRPSERISTGWLYAVLCSGINIQEIVNETKGSAGQVNISLSQCRDFVFPLPPLTEQTEIVRRVQRLFAMADAMEAEFAAAQWSVDQLDQSLLATAFRGELVPQDPSDEPASVLLERIRAARAIVPEAKGKRGRKASSDFDASLLMAAEPTAPKKRGRPRQPSA